MSYIIIGHKISFLLCERHSIERKMKWQEACVKYDAYNPSLENV